MKTKTMGKLTIKENGSNAIIELFEILVRSGNSDYKSFTFIDQNFDYTNEQFAAFIKFCKDNDLNLNLNAKIKGK